MCQLRHIEHATATVLTISTTVTLDVLLVVWLLRFIPSFQHLATLDQLYYQSSTPGLGFCYFFTVRVGGPGGGERDGITSAVELAHTRVAACLSIQSAARGLCALPVPGSLALRSQLAPSAHTFSLR